MYASSGYQNSYGRLRYVIGSYKMDQPACPDWDRNGMLNSSLPNLLSSLFCLPASYPGFPPTAQSSIYWWRDFWRAAPAKTPRRYVHFRSRKRAENTLCWQRHLQIARLTTALFSPISQVLREELEAKQVRYHLGEFLAVLCVPEGSSGSAGLPEGIGRGTGVAGRAGDRVESHCLRRGLVRRSPRGMLKHAFCFVLLAICSCPPPSLSCCRGERTGWERTGGPATRRRCV